MSEHVVVSFGSLREVTLARSACRRVLAAGRVHLSRSHRAAIQDALALLHRLGVDNGPLQLTVGPPLLQALHFAVNHERDQMVGRSEPDGEGTSLSALNRVFTQLSEGAGWTVADPHVLAVVRLAFGDLHGSNVSAADVEALMPDRATFEACLIDVIGTYHRFSGEQIATEFAPLWDRLGQVHLGRRPHPQIRIELSQHSAGDGGRPGELLPTEVVQDMALALIHAGRRCGALVLAHTVAQQDPDSLLHDATVRPAQVLWIWIAR